MERKVLADASGGSQLFQAWKKEWGEGVGVGRVAAGCGLLDLDGMPRIRGG